jgi:hypothetical protein
MTKARAAPAAGAHQNSPANRGIQHAEPHVLSALVSKRAELAGEIEGLERQAASPISCEPICLT